MAWIQRFRPLVVGLLATAGSPQQHPGPVVQLRGFGTATNLIIPQSRSFRLRGSAATIKIASVQVRVRILEQTASTSLEIALENPAPRQQEAVLLMPVPAGAAVSSFVFDGAQQEPTARVLPREEARRLYDRIVGRLRDPALLEFVGRNLVRSSVFPVPAGGRQKVRLTYDHVLSGDGSRVDYVLPRSESLDQSAPWNFRVEIRSKTPISMVYSPTHDITKKRRSPNHVSVRFKPRARMQPGSFLLSYVADQGSGVAASMFAYPDPKLGGGYFLLLAGLPARTGTERKGLRRDVTLVLDRSGSMAGKKLDQGRAAALQVIAGLGEGESFNIIDYATAVAAFSASPVRKTAKTVEAARQYLAALRPGGGTNLHDALVEALRQEPQPGSLPIMLFLTDGLPTVGRTRETEIRDLVEKGNAHKRRIFTFGVGHDVNVPLLDRIAETTRATTTYVLPNESVEVKVAGVFRKLFGPVLADGRLDCIDEQGAIDTRRVRELQPPKLPDLFENDKLVLLGQYRGEKPLAFRLSGNYLGQPRSFTFEFGLRSATTRNSFVPRLWASRRIAYLVDQVRQRGAVAAALPRIKGASPFADPRLGELRDEILRLSTQFGILTEYTSFLATEGTRLGDWKKLVSSCGAELGGKAILTRSGRGAVNQGKNLLEGKSQTKLNRRNSFLDNKLNRVEVTTVQQVCDRAFFKRGKRWIDSRLVLRGKLTWDEVIEFGSAKHKELLKKLAAEGRQAVLSLRGEILIWTPERVYLVRNMD